MQNSCVSKLNLLNRVNKDENKINAIIFIEGDDFSQKLIVKEAKENVCLASSIEIDYSFLYKDLLDKCNPSNYMNPYDAKKVEISNSIYSQIEENKNGCSSHLRSWYFSCEGCLPDYGNHVGRKIFNT